MNPMTPDYIDDEPAEQGDWEELAVALAEAEAAKADLAEAEAEIARLRSELDAHSRNMGDLTRYLGKNWNEKVVISATPWGENGILETPFINAWVADWLRHSDYVAGSQDTTVEQALLSLSSRIAADTTEGGRGA